MGLFNEAFEKTKDVAQMATDKAKDIANITKIKADIATEQRKIKEQYLVIGKLYYENYSGVPDDIFAEAVNAIKDIEATIAEKTKELNQEEEKCKEAEENKVVYCPNCGVKIEGSANFCSNCGAKINRE